MIYNSTGREVGSGRNKRRNRWTDNYDLNRFLLSFLSLSFHPLLPGSSFSYFHGSVPSAPSCSSFLPPIPCSPFLLDCLFDHWTLRISLAENWNRRISFILTLFSSHFSSQMVVSSFLRLRVILASFLCYADDLVLSVTFKTILLVLLFR